MNEKLEKAKEEKIEAEDKYERVKKSLKEIEATYNGQLSQLEREKAGLHEKLIANENKKAEIEKRLHQENQQLSAQIYDLKEQFNNEKAKLLAEIEAIRNQYHALDQQHSDLEASYEREKTLWIGKFSFLEQQKNQCKADLIEAQKNFEVAIQQIQKHRSSDKEETKTTQSALLSTVESRYQQQIEELNESHRIAMQEAENKIKKLEKQIKLASEKKPDPSAKLGKTYLEKKVSELTENEKKLKKELEKYKEMKDIKFVEIQKAHEKEKQLMKEKLEEIDQKLKESEARKCSLIFEHEKERAKWNAEKDSFLIFKNEQQENMAKLEKRLEALLRENEKYKLENKSNRRTMNFNTMVPTANIVLSKGSTVLTSSICRNRPSSPMSASSTRSTSSDPEKLKDLTNFTGTKLFESSKKPSLNRSSTEMTE